MVANESVPRGNTITVVVAMVLMLSVLLLDLILPSTYAVAPLYAVLLLVGCIRRRRRRIVILASVCTVLSLLAGSPLTGQEFTAIGFSNLCVTWAAVWLVAMAAIKLSDQERRLRLAFKTLSGQKALLETEQEATRFLVESLQDKTTELEAANEAVHAASVAKGEFLANMSHEIRTPMTAIVGYCDLLAEEHVTGRAAECAEIIQRNGHHLLAIINDILDLTKFESGKMKIERIEFSPAQLVEEVVSLMRVRCVENGLSLKAVFDGPIPESVVSDPTRVRQILLNLVGNAIKFTPEGSVRITLSYEPDDNRLRLSVADTGIGIDEQTLEELFEPFAQADCSTTRRFGGTGLGLSISQRLAELLGGSIEVRSTPGEGSVFSMIIAADAAEGARMLRLDEAAHALPAGRKGVDPGDQLAGIAILLAEDGQDNRRLIRHFLERHGAKVNVVENGRRAVDIALDAETNARPFDVVLMDMQMPVMDGYTATRVLREAGYARPIIALTAHATTEYSDRCFDAGCDAFHAKPVDWPKLFKVIRAWVPVRA